MNLLDLLRQDGISPQKVSNTNGGEWAGPCPLCGGEDRFRVWESTDRYWCRGCGIAGDCIQYLRDCKGLSYPEACLALGKEPTITPQSYSPTIRPPWTPKTACIPNEMWREKAGIFIDWTQKQLWTNAGAAIRDSLYDRGLNDSVINSACLGWNPKDVYRGREEWGLPPEANAKGLPKKLWLPKGLVIPTIHEGDLVRLRIRRPKPKAGPRYYFCPGGSPQPMWLGRGDTAVVVESELDGALVAQETPQDIFVVAVGSAMAKPDEGLHGALMNSGRILVALDADDAGAKASRWWLDTYPQAIRWPVPVEKDPGDAFKAGLSIRAWIEAGLPELEEREAC